VTYVDTHCHLDHHPELRPDEQVTRARDAGVRTLITVGTDVSSSQQAVATAARFDGVFAAVGIHPNDADTATPEALATIASLATRPEVVAIGETGLDRYRDHTTPAQQDPAFRAQIDLAKQHDLTLVIHCRDAWPACLAVLDEEGAPARVVMHCFSGDLEVVRRCADAGWYVSFAGNVTFRNAQDLRDAAAAAPAALLLTETDSPYLTPHPHRGRWNDPSYVPHTLRALAATRGEDPADLAAVVRANTGRAFALPTGSADDPS
jgi:TatD DNase family protein